MGSFDCKSPLKAAGKMTKSMCLILLTLSECPQHLEPVKRTSIHLAVLSALGSGTDIQFKATQWGGRGRRWTSGTTVGKWLWNKSVVEWSGIILSPLFDFSSQRLLDMLVCWRRVGGGSLPSVLFTHGHTPFHKLMASIILIYY